MTASTSSSNLWRKKSTLRIVFVIMLDFWTVSGICTSLNDFVSMVPVI